VVQPAVRAQQIAVVGGAHQHGVIRTAGDCAPDPVDRGVNLGMKAVVKVAVALAVALIDLLDRSGRTVAGVVGLAERDLCGRFGAQILIGGGCRRHRRRIQVRGLQRAAQHPRREQHDVMRVDETRHQQEGPQRRFVTGAAAGVAILQPGHHPVGD
jgi:hypothetical protein